LRLAPAFPKSVGLPEGSADFVPVLFLNFFIALRLLRSDHSWLNHFFSEVSNPYLPAMLTKALLSGCPFTVFFPRHLAEILWLNNSFPDEASHGIVFPPLTFQVNYWPSSFSTDCPAMNFFLSISRHYGRLTQLASSYLFFTMMAFTPPHLFVHRNELKMINRSFYFRNK
jgi:hypothetical protein